MPKIATAAIAAALLSACASGAQKHHTANQGPAAGLNQSERLLSYARKLQTEKDCKTAIPAYRVIASFGEGYEVAQYELGACLLDAAADDDREASLFTQEAMVWLTRAAWAGDARAQKQLAARLSGAPDNALAGPYAKPTDAMGWALVYDNNPAKKLYALTPLHPAILTHLDATLADAEKNAAAAFAKEFAKIKMAAFVPPTTPKRAQRSNGSRPNGGQQRRRRRQ